MTKSKLKPIKPNSIDQSVNVTQSGNHNNATIHYQSPPTDDEIAALRDLMEAQQKLIRLYQKRNHPT